MNTKWCINDAKTRLTTFDIPIDYNILSILSKRGINKIEDVINFINPKLDNLIDPIKMKDLSLAVKYIIENIQEDKKICIYGDYDVDGISSTSLLYLALKKLKAKNISYYIPLRNEGYGLNKEAILSLKNEGIDLIITVDCGISSYEEVEYANSLGLKMIITDHHDLPSYNLPRALAVVNPKIESDYHFDKLAGVGVAFMIVYELFRNFNIEKEAFSYLDLVTLGTIADIMPLVDQNRIIVKYGLNLMQNSNNLGIKTMIKLLSLENKELTTGDISFKIAPIFNASGRLSDAKLGVKLLTSENINEVLLLCNNLIDNNQIRKNIQEECIKKALSEFENLNLKDEYILISHSPEYHHGIIGIVASKIVDKFYLPAIIIEENTLDGTGVGSCRSINGFNINKALSYASKTLIKFGGHSGAAGFTLKLENLKEFKRLIKEYAKKELENINIAKPINIDMEIPAQKISYEFLQSLNLLKPFGFGNPAPMLLTKNCIINNLNYIGKNKEHLNLDLEQKGFIIKNVKWFNNADKLDKIKKGSIFYDIVFKLESSDYKDFKYLNVYIEDMKPSNLKDDRFKFFNSMHNTSFPMKSIFYTKFDISENDKIHIKENYKQYSVLLGQRSIGKLGENISNLLSKLSEFYNHEFDVKIESIIKNENHNTVNILIKKKYELINYAVNDKTKFLNIKNFISKDFEYNSFTKESLAKYFKENKSILINENNINVFIEDEKIEIKPSFYYKLILNVAMKYFFDNNKKINFYTTNKFFTNYNELKPYANFISKTTPNLVENEAIFDFNTVKNYKKLKYTKALIFDKNDIDNINTIRYEKYFNKNFLRIKNHLDKVSNVNFYDFIFTNYLPNSIKKELISLSSENKIILTDDSIIEYI